MSTVQVCVCTRCMLLGAPDLLESLHQLQELQQQLEVPSFSCTTTCQHPEGVFPGPAVQINGLPCPQSSPRAVLEQLVQAEAVLP